MGWRISRKLVSYENLDFDDCTLWTVCENVSHNLVYICDLPPLMNPACEATSSASFMISSAFSHFTMLSVITPRADGTAKKT